MWQAKKARLTLALTQAHTAHTGQGAHATGPGWRRSRRSPSAAPQGWGLRVHELVLPSLLPLAQAFLVQTQFLKTPIERQCSNLFQGPVWGSTFLVSHFAPCFRRRNALNCLLLRFGEGVLSKPAGLWPPLHTPPNPHTHLQRSLKNTAPLFHHPPSGSTGCQHASGSPVFLHAAAAGCQARERQVPTGWLSRLLSTAVKFAS